MDQAMETTSRASPTDEATAGELAPDQFETPQHPRPEMWIGTTDDYAGAKRYGDWIDAGERTRYVFAAIRNVIERTPDALGKRWRICELRGFGGWQPGEGEGLETALNVGRGVARHGPAFGALTARLGADSKALTPERYPQSYLGSWPSLRAFVETVVRDSGWHEQLAALPATMQPFVRLDLRKVAAVARRDLTIIEHDAGVWVYDPRIW
jgi:Antirestriction protein (ArdA)